MVLIVQLYGPDPPRHAASFGRVQRRGWQLIPNCVDFSRFTGLEFLRLITDTQSLLDGSGTTLICLVDQCYFTKPACNDDLSCQLRHVLSLL